MRNTAALDGQRQGRTQEQSTRWRVGGIELEMLARGPVGSESKQPGESILLLHDVDYFNSIDYPFIELLAERRPLLAPSHPGFGASGLPDGFDSIDDLAYVYLDLLRELGPAHVIGCGFGGWIAAEVAVRCTHQIRSLVLVDALGIKMGDRTTSDIADVFVLSPTDLIKLSWHNTDRGNVEMALPVADHGFDEDALTVLLTNRRTAALIGWNPFMHNPKLLSRLRRIDCPCLVVWGASDGIVSPDYGRGFASAIPSARFQVVEEAGHYPYLEQPAAFVGVVEEFLAGVSRE